MLQDQFRSPLMVKVSTLAHAVVDLNFYSFFLEWTNCNIMNPICSDTMNSSGKDGVLIDARWVSTPLQQIDVNILHTVRFFLVCLWVFIVYQFLTDELGRTLCDCSRKRINISPFDWRWLFAVSIIVDVNFFITNNFNLLRRVPCILITSCGYPDVATRAIVARLLQMYPVRMYLITLKLW